MTIADMNRLEQAARISMGEFLESEPSMEALPEAGRGLMKGIVLAAAAIMVLAIFWQLT
ncbi:hypothetical protein LB524_12185 [Mesorhizobium sp. ESP6-5]|uniref:Uncharacterized protein n=1 Tax=Mesorhizobium australicum (strain HAMBI 3006 / LMG 24608 / WSM2073) TaxID=754035 RepID=L0KG01_MESAW|nr:MULTISPECIES: hypothetical protein [Mesorhizobium]MBZ9930920.1 hypothetical protein [Mesorhizobium sp. BR1-1-5]AGB43931.1 hypothetical protein Mesau_01463 [Mesorhizobium australicum WSM2073]MBZ9679096.1 hypothetical protein [Mesorhizobium sp. CO1-1-2]MBZ9695605.1 hypothetical protein [Mesorhizobium sp. CO1-1-9]MBZ9756048.1 hypothetical protein [Mesorhizobium sp. ESP6-5]